MRVGDLPDSSLVSVRIADNRRLCVATPPICSATARRATPATCCSLTASRCRAKPRRSGLGVRACPPKGRHRVGYLKPGGPLDCSDGQGAARLVPCSGYGIAWRSTWEVEAEIAAGRLVEVLADFAAPPNGILRGISPAQAHAPAGAAVDRIPQAAIRAAAFWQGR